MDGHRRYQVVRMTTQYKSRIMRDPKEYCVP